MILRDSSFSSGRTFKLRNLPTHKDQPAIEDLIIITQEMALLTKQITLTAELILNIISLLICVRGVRLTALAWSESGYGHKKFQFIAVILLCTSLMLSLLIISQSVITYQLTNGAVDESIDPEQVQDQYQKSLLFLHFLLGNSVQFLVVIVMVLSAILSWYSTECNSKRYDIMGILFDFGNRYHQFGHSHSQIYIVRHIHLWRIL